MTSAPPAVVVVNVPLSLFTSVASFGTTASTVPSLSTSTLKLPLPLSVSTLPDGTLKFVPLLSVNVTIEPSSVITASLSAVKFNTEL